MDNFIELYSNIIQFIIIIQLIGVIILSLFLIQTSLLLGIRRTLQLF